MTTRGASAVSRSEKSRPITSGVRRVSKYFGVTKLQSELTPWFGGGSASPYFTMGPREPRLLLSQSGNALASEAIRTPGRVSMRRRSSGQKRRWAVSS
ncbi:MAG: hypothetical protein J2P21_23110 [Chloracidobacterium sp.]|nr:hypothetical protein [Chloracidobacterium sp.]